jgi:hypothetical protein
MKLVRFIGGPMDGQKMIVKPSPEGVITFTDRSPAQQAGDPSGKVHTYQLGREGAEDVARYTGSAPSGT